MLDKKLLKNFDFMIVILICLLVGFGAIGIGIAMRSPTEGQGGITEMIGNFNLKYVQLHLLWAATGLVLMLITASIDYNVLKDMSAYIYWIIVALLLYVDAKGNVAGNAQSWIVLGPFKLQPSEFAKLAIIITTAKVLSKDEESDGKLSHLKDLIPLIVKIAIPLVLVAIQPDFGTATVFMAIIFGILFVAGISYKLLFGIIGAGVACIPLLWFGFLSDVQKNRILVFLNPGLDPLGEGYHVTQSLIAIGSGQIYGKGLLTDNTLSQLNFLPAKHTDFIFSVTAEALGFMGGIIIILLYLALIIRTMKIASKSKDKFGALLVTGVASMIMFHIFENIGMTMGLMPVTGIPLPFMSYGGSSMWTNMIAYGMVLSVGMRRQKIKF
ncbi:MAG: rod shape-determining protein RodA [Xylanivirga thermophila]|jgi:rod shape determining protein RodA|uniref:rod shape-determining protein RodA n=1 Tax=Xylanivirga thermophila TaxID=2496273 RepID=UPI00101BC341|nr:rod shape-determining protein RodA [Xylanivirga thermophila]